MNYLKRKKKAFIPIISSIKGFERVAKGTPLLVLDDCVDEDSVIDYTIEGAGDEASGVGEKTVNLFDSTQLLEASGWTVNENGEYTGSVANAWSKFNNTGSFNIELPGEAVQMSVSFEGRNETTNNRTFSIGFYYTDGTHTAIASQYISSTEWQKYRLQSVRGKKVSRVVVEYSNRDTVWVRNIQITATASYLPYEPYGKYKIPVKTRSEQGEEKVTNIYLSSPLVLGKSINKKSDNLPDIPTFTGATDFSLDTDTGPKSIEVIYYSTSKQ